jgi:hypothetical protein
MLKVLITTVPFGDKDRYPLELLEKNNIEYLINGFIQANIWNNFNWK